MESKVKERSGGYSYQTKQIGMTFSMKFFFSTSTAFLQKNFWCWKKKEGEWNGESGQGAGLWVMVRVRLDDDEVIWWEKDSSTFIALTGYTQ